MSHSTCDIYLTSDEMLRALVNCDGARIALADATTSIVLLEMLSQDPDRRVLSAVARNPNTPEHVLARLVADYPAQVGQNPSTSPQLLASLAHHTDYNVKFRVAQNPNTRAEDLIALSLSTETPVRWRIARHPNTPTSTLWDLASDVGIVAEDVPLNPNVTPELLERVVTSHPFAEIKRTARQRVVEHPKTSVETLVFMYENETDEALRSKCLERLGLLDLLK